MQGKLPADLAELEPQRQVYKNYDNDWSMVAGSMGTSLKDALTVDICKRRSAADKGKDDSSDSSPRSNLEATTEEQMLTEASKKLESMYTWYTW